MTIREELEQREHMMLSPWAARADGTRGRLRPEEENEVRTCYQRDVDRIVYCKSFRRLKHKTQVFLQPEGDHYRTRLTHTLEVMRISRTIARALQLNEDLTEAIAFGHDLGHTPFGHAGEKALSDITGKAFRHNEQSLRVVDILEKDGEGLNLTYETRMGIVGHTGDFIPETFVEVLAAPGTQALAVGAAQHFGIQIQHKSGVHDVIKISAFALKQKCPVIFVLLVAQLRYQHRRYFLSVVPKERRGTAVTDAVQCGLHFGA